METLPALIVREGGVESRDGARTSDIVVGDGGPGDVAAWLVRPDRPADGLPPAALVAHGFDPDAPDGNRDRFPGEARVPEASG
jgi:hypothetical protein